MGVLFQIAGNRGDDHNSRGRADRNSYISYGLHLLTVVGCYFTKYCKELAEQIGICGWVKNSKKGTIVGKIQGTKASMDHMIDWLTTAGSPGCKIEKCDLTNREYLVRPDYKDFSIRF